MSLVQFLTSLDSHFSQDKRYLVTYFQTESYPIIFSLLLRNYIRTNYNASLYTYSLADESVSALQIQLETYFLGSSLSYWLTHSLGDLEKAKQKEITRYIKQYQGPHTVICFGQEELTGTHINTVIIPQSITKEILYTLLPMLGMQRTAREELFIKKLGTYQATLSLDTACLLLYYGRLLNRNQYDEFFNYWFGQLVDSKQSLFKLSQLFFAKQAGPFFKEWQQIRQSYATQFWISFWSEQIWRAYNFIYLARAHNWIEAKKISARLPFSFMQRDWKQIKLDELYNAHQSLYTLDYKLKHGVSEIGLELFYNTFFLNEFCVNKYPLSS